MGLFDLFSDKPAQDAAAAQKAGLNAGYTQASDSLGQGRDALTTNFTNALAPFTQNYGVASGGQNAYADATGANGATGYANAKANFQTNPGYQFQLQQGNENVLRNASRTGQLASGGTNLDLQKQGQGLADQSYQQYVANLQPFLGASNAAATGGAAVSTGLGTGLNNSFGSQANLGWQQQTGIGNANANADLAKYSTGANILGALMGGAGALFGGGGLFGANGAFGPKGAFGSSGSSGSGGGGFTNALSSFVG